tara:strand:+ start:2432 stop:3358 length:927 start_codon:yes stop_codon:yes gene_type:complete
VIRLLISFFVIILVASCQPISQDKNISKIIDKSKKSIEKKIEKISEEKTNLIDENQKDNIFYYIGDPYFIEGVEYKPEENYFYNETGLATFYGKELHNSKTVNNDRNKVTELLGRHKTLPIPSIVKVTNLENGLSITIKIIDRHQNNSSIIEVSRKVAQLLRFYKYRIAKVRVEILSDPSKQWKSVALSMNEENFNNTVESAPTDIVSISSLDDQFNTIDEKLSNELPIEIGSEPIENKELFLKVFNFNSYEDIQKIIKALNLTVKTTTEKDGEKYNLLLGPINNDEANKLVSSFISKGYKKNKIILD